MKRVLTLLIAFTLCLSITACKFKSTIESMLSESEVPSSTSQESITPSINSEESSQASAAENEVTDPIGKITIEDITNNSERFQDMYSQYYKYSDYDGFGVWVQYSDGSLSPYYGGNILRHDEAYMTYGTDYLPDDLVMRDILVYLNNSLLEDVENLVMFWPSKYETVSIGGLFKVEEWGRGLTGRNGDYLARRDGAILKIDYNRFALSWPLDYTSLLIYDLDNNVEEAITREEFEQSEIFTSAKQNENEFASFKFNHSYEIDIIDGTTLTHTGGRSEVLYFLYSADNDMTVSKSDENLIPFNQIPTTNGYAILDFSDTPAGEYVFVMSFWDMERDCRIYYSTFLAIDNSGHVVKWTGFLPQE